MITYIFNILYAFNWDKNKKLNARMQGVESFKNLLKDVNHVFVK